MGSEEILRVERITTAVARTHTRFSIDDVRDVLEMALAGAGVSRDDEWLDATAHEISTGRYAANHPEAQRR